MYRGKLVFFFRLPLLLLPVYLNPSYVVICITTFIHPDMIAAAKEGICQCNLNSTLLRYKERPGVFIYFALVRARKINTRDVIYVTEVPRAQITFFSLVICPRAVTNYMYHVVAYDVFYIASYD